MIDCVICGKQFQPIRKTNITCSAACSREYKKRRSREYMREYLERKRSGAVKTVRRRCEICGEKYDKGFRGFCSEECWKISKIKVKFDINETISGAGQTHDNKNIDLISDAADKCGMTYGQYQAQKYLKNMERIKV